jgi:hypothetical protein
MIVADKNALKASLQQSISQILSELVDLYSKNLNALGVQCSAIAGLAIAIIFGSSYDDVTSSKENIVLMGAYYTFGQISIMSALGAVMLSIISAQYGPSLALTGDSLSIVAYGM